MKSVRKGVCPPACSFLFRLQRNGVLWKNFSDPVNRDFAEKKAVLRATLLQIQRGQCVYCERPVNGKKCKIEHFYPRSNYGQLVFDWNNLFISCDSSNTCSDWKDGPKGKLVPLTSMFRPDDLTHQIEDCFDCENGQLCAASTASEAEKALVQGTIAKANLNHVELVAQRQHLTEWVMSFVDPQTGEARLSAAEMKDVFADRGFESLLQRLARRYFQ